LHLTKEQHTIYQNFNIVQDLLKESTRCSISCIHLFEMLLKGLLESQSKSSVFWRASQVSHLLLRSISSWLVLLCTTSCVIAIYVMRSLMPVMLTCRWRLLTTKWHLTRWESRFGEGKFVYVPLKDHKFRYIPSLSHWHVEFTWVNDMWVRWYISNFWIF